MCKVMQGQEVVRSRLGPFRCLDQCIFPGPSILLWETWQWLQTKSLLIVTTSLHKQEKHFEKKFNKVNLMKKYKKTSPNLTFKDRVHCGKNRCRFKLFCWHSNWQTPRWLVEVMPSSLLMWHFLLVARLGSQSPHGSWRLSRPFSLPPSWFCWRAVTFNHNFAHILSATLHPG